MIVPMKKYSLLVFYKDLDGFLAQLQEFGVVDISRTKKTLEGKDKEMVGLYARYAVAIRKLKALNVEKTEMVFAEKMTAEQILNEYEELVEKQEQTNTLLKVTAKEVDDVAVWGMLNPADIERLRKLGFIPRFYYATRKRYSTEWEQQYAIQILNENDKSVYFVALQQSDISLAIEAQELKAPSFTLEEKQAELAQLQEASKSIAERLNILAGYVPVLRRAMLDLSDQIDYSSVKQSAEGKTEDKVMLLTGWIPEDNKVALETFLNEQDVLYLEGSIEDSDNVPIKLKNNRFARLFEPITQMYSMPNYREIDVTAFFAPFYMLFFGFCFGDAGYGVLLILIATIIKPKLKGSTKMYASLIQWLGVATILFGALTGMFFGIKLHDLELFSSVKDLFITNDDHLILLSISLGAVQVFLGMGLDAYKTYKQKGFKFALHRIAWIVGLLSTAALFGLPYLGVGVSAIFQYILYVLIGLSLLIILFYNSPGKNPLLNLGLAAWNAFNMATGLLGDLLSYVRLFALGLTGGMLGGAFNNIAEMLSPNIPVVGFLVSFIILIFGHSLNFGLNMLGALIHPIRLTFVEFFKNSGYEGGGAAYKPFKYNQTK